MKFVVYQGPDGKWWWRLDSTRGESVARCGAPYASQQQAVQDIQKLRIGGHRALVFDPLGNLIPHK